MAQKSNRKGRSSGLSLGEGFFAMHPFEEVFFDTDRYYNDIAKKILPLLEPMIDKLNCNEPIVRRMALCIAAYFEDQVSELGLWGAFIHRYRELYGRWLPWYDTSNDYYEDEVNLQDIMFLLWMINVSTEEYEYTTPFDPTIEECARKIFLFLVDEFENAPINKPLVDLVYSDRVTEDYYTLKKVLIWMTKTCYLMAVPIWEANLRQTVDKALKSLADMDDMVLSYAKSSYLSVHLRVGPLALYPNEWFVLMRKQKGFTKDNDKILEIKGSPMYPFMVVLKDDDTVTLRSCRDVDYKVAKDSFSGSFGNRLKIGDCLVTTLAYYNGYWGVNGLCSFLPNQAGKAPQEFLKETAQHLTQNGRAIDLMGTVDTSVKNPIPSEWKARLDEEIAKNHGDRLFYFPSARAAMDWQQMIVGTQKVQRDKESEKQFGDQAVMVFVAPDDTMNILSLAASIADPSNPYYNPEKGYLGGKWLYNKFGIPDDFVAFLVKRKYLKNISFDADEPQSQYSKLIEDNLPFWATFMRQYPC